MLNRKALIVALLNFILLFAINTSQAAMAVSNDNPAKNVLTLEISAPAAIPGLQSNQKPNPIYLQITMNNGSSPVYSAPVLPGDSNPVELKITSIGANGAQLQFVANSANAVQPMSFIYAFTGERLACLLNKNAKLQIIYNINNKLLDVQGIPSDC